MQCLSEASAGLDCLKFVHTVPVMGLSSSKKWDPKRTRLVAATTALTRGADFTKEAGGERGRFYCVLYISLSRLDEVWVCDPLVEGLYSLYRRHPPHPRSPFPSLLSLSLPFSSPGSVWFCLVCLVYRLYRRWLRLKQSASLVGLEEVVLEGQDTCKGLATSASVFRHTLGELDASLDVLRLRETWAGDRPSNGVSCPAE